MVSHDVRVGRTSYPPPKRKRRRVRETVRVDPVGEREIADRLDVQPSTVHQWQARKLLPPSRWVVSGSPAWDWSDIEEWAIRSGRLWEGT